MLRTLTGLFFRTGESELDTALAHSIPCPARSGKERSPGEPALAAIKPIEFPAKLPLPTRREERNDEEST